jgi:hypothetical protein
MKKAEVTKLEKTYKVFEDAKDGSEDQAKALEALKASCKAHAIRLSDFVQGAKGKSHDFDFRADKSETAPVSRTRADGKPSRRSVIIDAVHEGKWTKVALAEQLEKDGYGSLGDCKKAISGTIYDISKNKGVDVREKKDGTVYVHVEKA